MSTWDLNNGRKIYLFTPEEFEKLPHGACVISISGIEKQKGVDICDQDVRFGYIAWGMFKRDYDLHISVMHRKDAGEWTECHEIGHNIINTDNLWLCKTCGMKFEVGLNGLMEAGKSRFLQVGEEL